MDTQQVSPPVALGGTLGIRTAQDIRIRLLAALAEEGPVLIDCSAAESVDLSIIQLLLAARLSAERAGKRLSLAAPAGGALRSALVQGGFLPADDAAPTGGDPFWSGAA